MRDDRKIMEELAVLALKTVHLISVFVQTDWDGPTYTRLLDTLLRILLRIHLAPDKEKAFKKRAAVKQEEAASHVGRKQPSRTARSWEIAKLSDELAGAMETQRGGREQAILRQLLQLESHAPNGLSKKGRSPSAGRTSDSIGTDSMCAKAKSRTIKRAVFGSFINLSKIDELCSHHGLSFSNRNFSGVDLLTEFEETGLSKEELQAKCQDLADQVNGVFKDAKKLRRDHANKELVQTDTSREEARVERYTAAESEAYARLRQAREDTRTIRAVLMPEEARLRSLKQNLYSCNKALTAAKEGDSKRPSPRTLTHATWDNSKVENAAKLLDIYDLLNNTTRKQRQVVFAGTDYGVCKMSETVTQTVGDIERHLNHHNSDDETKIGSGASEITTEDMGTDAGESDTEQSHSESGLVDMDTDESGWVLTPSQLRKKDLNSIKLPASHKTTAEQLNDITHSRRNDKKRERRLKNNNIVKAALE
ncbi:hypothetical protein BGX28_009592 [Mortierella sp. GBA30]|nr:hypothetical protein BGX28_009592 [Mortierella sp. GBA30]